MSESEKDDFQEVPAENKKQSEIFPGARQQEESIKAPRLDTNTSDKKCFVPEQPKGINPNQDTKFSIFAAIANDDSFIFEIMGSEKTFSNLVGLSDFISARVQQEKDKKLQTGDALTSLLFQNIHQLNTKVDALISYLDKPTNKL